LEGGESGEVYILKSETVIGRTQGDISFAFDELMSSKHGRIVRRGEDFIYIDEDSRNGTFIKIKKEIRLEPGDVLLIGKQLFRFEA
jgi:pSer/pThr/pTyr-binding forkhead associated (FHA) protein